MNKADIYSKSFQPELSNINKSIVSNNALKFKQNIITNVNQTFDLNKTEAVDIVNVKYERIDQWLASHSLEHFKLTMKDLFSCAKISKPELNKKEAKLEHKFRFDNKEFLEFQFKINNLIQLYTNKIKHLLHGSQKVFGTIMRKNVAVLIDSSESNLSIGRSPIFINHIMTLLNEQLLECDKLYFSSFASELNPLRKGMEKITANFINEIRSWVSDLSATKGCNLLGALKEAMNLNPVDTVLLILGSVPDQNMRTVCDYVSQVNLINRINIHTVSYELCDQATNEGFKTLAQESNGIFYCYNTLYEELIYTSSEIEKLFVQIKRCNEILEKMQIMREGRLGMALIEISNQINENFIYLPPTLKKAFPAGHCLPLRLELPNFKPSTSAEWLKEFGLKAKRLDLYQVLAPDSYAYREQFVSTIGKSVRSKVHGQLMTQFDWKDGTRRNVHVNSQTLDEYQRKLGQSVAIFERRLDWLLSDSRLIFGSVVEDSVILIIDLSIPNAKNLFYLQSCLRKLLEQQISNKKYFNIIACCECILSFKPEVIQPTGLVLQEAWNWLLNLECGGSRDILGALRAVYENENEIQHYIEVEGVYLIISGMPDQPPDILSGYVEEKSAGRKTVINSVLMQTSENCNLNDSDFGRYGHISKISETLKTLSHSTGGRFHFFQENGSVVSDDITALKCEIEKAFNFSSKCSSLLENVAMVNKIKTKDIPERDTPDLSETVGSVKPTLIRKETALSKARQNMISEKEKLADQIPKTLSYKDGQVYKPPSCEEDDQIKKNAKKKDDKNAMSYFYTDGKAREKGAVFEKYSPSKKSAVKISSISIKDTREYCTSKEWMSKYSLSKLKLDLNKMSASNQGQHITHSQGVVDILNKNVHARFCSALPTVVINGSVRHPLLSPNQMLALRKRMEDVLDKYLDRLQWLVSGSRLGFGTLVDEDIVFLIDVSGSMETKLPVLKSQLKLLLWEQLRRRGTRFNMIAFSADSDAFDRSLVESNDENCRRCEQWIDSLVASGQTGLLAAIKEAFALECCRTIYLVTDGRPETSAHYMLTEVDKLNLTTPPNRRTTGEDGAVVKAPESCQVEAGSRREKSRKKINTISLSCWDREANEFLYTLAKRGGGRYHVWPEDESKIFLFTHQLKQHPDATFNECVMPVLDGDDLNRLGNEIDKTRKNLILWQSISNKSGTEYNDCADENEFSLIDENQLINLLT